jgi:ribosomal protein L22
VKKLGALARQIAHKDIDHAITQMRFSAKRAARSVVRGLEHAKEEAIRLSEMKEGQIIVDRAWVGRGGYKPQVWPRARGRRNVRMRPFTHFVVTLKPAGIVQKQVDKVQMRKISKRLGKPTRGQERPIYNPRPYYAW